MKNNPLIKEKLSEELRDQLEQFFDFHQLEIKCASVKQDHVGLLLDLLASATEKHLTLERKATVTKLYDYLMDFHINKLPKATKSEDVIGGHAIAVAQVLTWEQSLAVATPPSTQESTPPCTCTIVGSFENLPKPYLKVDPNCPIHLPKESEESDEFSQKG